LSARAQQSFIRPVILALVDGSTSPNPGTANAVAMSSVTGVFMRWTGSYWLSMGTTFNFVQATVDFGFPAGGEDGTTSVAVSAPWTTAQTVLVCQPAPAGNTDHSAEDAAVEGIIAYAANLRPGNGFDLFASAPRGTWGQYLINVVGR
jgi:hypothetical protein